MKRRIQRLSLIGASLALVLLLLDGQANAGMDYGCSVSRISYAETPAGGQLIVICSNGARYQTNPSFSGTCHATDINTVKEFQAIAMAAFLAGKKLDFSYENGGPCGALAIWSLEMSSP